MISSLLGSLGLFLLGMWLMTEGLKLAGGKALENLLGSWTRNRVRALAAGTLITALVQSSSAVTVAAIGFVNAGLLNFQQSVWVVFGSNVGTTLTAWIVTFFGFSVKIDAFTFPLIGVGAALRIFAPYEKGKALGMALAGFGLLFMGIDALKGNFSEYANAIDITALVGSEGREILWGFVIGFILTVLTQSSSAAIAIILTAVASGVAGIELAAAAVVGANVGTTSTALLASIGATPNAKRLSWAHVAFNLITGVVALIALPLFLSIVVKLTPSAGSELNLTLMLAVFHSCFNLLGVILMWPIEPYLTRFLAARYHKKAQKPNQLHYIDTNVASVPVLALRAVQLELEGLIAKISRFKVAPQKQLAEGLEDVEGQITAIKSFIAKTAHERTTEQQGEMLSAYLSTVHYLENAIQTYETLLELHREPGTGMSPSQQRLDQWLTDIDQFNQELSHLDPELQQTHWESHMARYQKLKKQLLSAYIAEKISMETIDRDLYQASLARRFIEQMIQAVAAFTATQTQNKEDSKANKETEENRNEVGQQPEEAPT